MTPSPLNINCFSVTGGQRLSGSAARAGQSWRWSADAEYVDIELCTFTEVADGSWRARSGTTRYRALARAKLESLLVLAGFTSSRVADARRERLLPADRSRASLNLLL